MNTCTHMTSALKRDPIRAVVMDLEGSRQFETLEQGECAPGQPWAVLVWEVPR